MSSQTEFGGSDPVPLVPGSLFGVRLFRRTAGGTLTGLAVQAPWRAGENVAKCYRDHLNSGSKSRRWDDYDDTHPVASRHCTCGFYAYYMDRLVVEAGPMANSWYTAYGPGSGKVFGVIEGSGRVTLGTRGFRCERARVVGVVTPSALRRGLHSATGWYGRLPEFTTWQDLLASHPATRPGEVQHLLPPEVVPPAAVARLTSAKVVRALRARPPAARFGPRPRRG